MKSRECFLLHCFIILVCVVCVRGSEDNVGTYELRKGNVSAKFTNWGATLISLVLPDKNGDLADIVLGYDSVDVYKNDSMYYGAIVGRVANRIAGAQFTLNGTLYKLDANQNKNMLHGGHRGFSDVVWKVKKHKTSGRSPKIAFTYHSKDGEQGFPGDLLVTVTYALSGKSKLRVNMKAKAKTKATPVNLATHTYWNLGGHNSGNILSNEIQIFASNFTPVNNETVPTGEIASVKGTPYDFLEPHIIESKMGGVPGGYDINYVLDGENDGDMRRAAVVHDQKSGRVMKVSTNQPGMQFYTGNYMNNVTGKGGYVYHEHAGLCLETQGFPDSLNHPNFPSQIVTPGKTYKHRMLFEFSTK